MTCRRDSINRLPLKIKDAINPTGPSAQLQEVFFYFIFFIIIFCGTLCWMQVAKSRRKVGAISMQHKNNKKLKKKKNLSSIKMFHMWLSDKDCEWAGLEEVRMNGRSSSRRSASANGVAGTACFLPRLPQTPWSRAQSPPALSLTPTTFSLLHSHPPSLYLSVHIFSSPIRPICLFSIHHKPARILHLPRKWQAAKSVVWG